MRQRTTHRECASVASSTGRTQRLRKTTVEIAIARRRGGGTRGAATPSMANVQITFLGMERSTAIEAQVRRWVDRLGRTSGRLLRCEAWIEKPHRHNRKGNTFRVRVELAVPGKTIVVSDTGIDHTHENAFVAVADAFRAARRQLRDHADVERGDIKLHA